VTTMSRRATRWIVDRRLLLFVLSKLHHIVSALFPHSLHNVHDRYVKNPDRFGIGFPSSRDHIPMWHVSYLNMTYMSLHH
jgi:hypothetical protein